MRAALPLFVVLLVAGCIIETLDAPASVRAQAQAWCTGDVDGTLQFMEDPFYFGNDGQLSGEALRGRLEEILKNKPHLSLSCPDRFDFSKFESLTAAQVEARFNISIDEYVQGYVPAAKDRFLIVPPFPNPNSDDPLQGFWRPSEDHWRQVALLDG